MLHRSVTDKRRLPNGRPNRSWAAIYEVPPAAVGSTQASEPSAYRSRFQIGTVGELVAHLRGLPGGNSLPERPFVAVNLQQAGFDQRLQLGDEVALLPPMAGG